MPGIRLASIDLPVPGGPIIRRLCPPAAAIVMARLTASWPRTSAKSRSLPPWLAAYVVASSSSYGSSSSSSLRNPTAWATDETGMTSTPSTTAASRLFSSGRMTPRNPLALASRAIDRPPLILRTRPSRASSPAIRYSLWRSVWRKLLPRSWPIAMARSRAGPSFFTSAGARLMSIAPPVLAYPLLAMARPTRSTDSFTAVWARPTMVVFSSPWPDESTSTSHRSGSMPMRTNEWMRAIKRRGPQSGVAGGVRGMVSGRGGRGNSGPRPRRRREGEHEGAKSRRGTRRRRGGSPRRHGGTETRPTCRTAFTTRANQLTVGMGEAARRSRPISVPPCLCGDPPRLLRVPFRAFAPSCSPSVRVRAICGGASGHCTVATR